MATAAPPPAPTSVPHDSDLELQHVLFFHRHGDRSPILTQVGANWKMTPEETAFWQDRMATPAQIDKLNSVSKVVGDDPSMPPHSIPRHRDMAPFAQLSAIGVDHMIGKGRTLRSQYEAFFQAKGVATDPHANVYALSSNIDRTIQSVQCLLYGMFPPSDQQSTQDNLFYVRTHKINLLAPNHPITILNEIEQLISHEIEKRDSVERRKIEELGEKLRGIVGLPEGHPVPWTAIRDGLTCRKAHGMPFPKGITDSMYDVMCEYDSWLWHQLFGQRAFCFATYEKGVLEVYTLLKSLTDATSNNKPRVAFFSAHDNSIVALISALELQVDRVLPEYGTVITFEVYTSRSTGKHYIKVLFEGTPVTFTGHEHSALCPFEHFELRARAFLDGGGK